jgi:hypothetical protein
MKYRNGRMISGKNSYILYLFEVHFVTNFQRPFNGLLDAMTKLAAWKTGPKRDRLKKDRG